MHVDVLRTLHHTGVQFPPSPLDSFSYAKLARGKPQMKTAREQQEQKLPIGGFCFESRMSRVKPSLSRLNQGTNFARMLLCILYI